MNKTRQSVIERRNAIKRLDSSKKLIIRINTGLVLFAASAVLNQLAPESQSTTVNAQSERLSPSDFLKNITGYAKDIAAKNDLYASVMIAQAALESAWGNSTLAQSPNYNLFGIKGEYNGNSVHVETQEDDGSGNYYTITDDFRKYDDYDQSLEDYASLLTGDDDPSNWRYEFYSGTRVSNTSTYQDATAYLTGRYATDTSYASKLNRVIEQYGLTQYDANGNVVEEKPAEEAVPGETVKPETPSTSVGNYIVKAGDSLYRIATNHGITLNALMEANNLSSYFIAPNQTLLIPGGTSNNNAGNTVEEEENNSGSDESGNTDTKPSTGGSYVVKAGDSYWGIANKHGISIAELQKLNGTTSYLIHPGQTLKVPGTTDSTTPETSKPDSNQGSDTTTGTSGSYTVKAGESLYAIATKHGMTVNQLRELNNLSGSLIHPGQSLKVSGSSVVSNETTQENTTDSSSSDNTSTNTPSSTSGTYTVQRGDSLYAIATKHGMTLSQLQSLNGLSSNLIHPGQVLNVSGSTATATSTAVVETPVESIESTVTPTSEVSNEAVSETPVTEATPTETVATGTHVVQAGETLYSIAQKYGVDVYKLIEANGGSNVLVGQVISLN
ncbi:LysM peptidoglycan-binding domain-containing protein [Aerococcaceae bacterium WS4759]|uniref:Peptidoglycan hydrolase n=1 Tax=Fundicoccus ignavus TaxID=2664442 RepID=A0A6I2GHM1_9LACT|nr:LysM peptidoglycan-binding domain-containing protein [Fundicoccus ignavus]MRI84991.1 LysM peptidoglycan-binding domain-containing protein [Fundicoccus ignavus]